mmetsp:Transcript_947/g.1328  ORF Transcript_947/g.1328 Transcript_947/m.1328 type:complete len:408 (-) Transcript_947:161-1384(-)
MVVLDARVLATTHAEDGQPVTSLLSMALEEYSTFVSVFSSDSSDFSIWFENPTISEEKKTKKAMDDNSGADVTSTKLVAAFDAAIAKFMKNPETENKKDMPIEKSRSTRLKRRRRILHKLLTSWRRDNDHKSSHRGPHRIVVFCQEGGDEIPDIIQSEYRRRPRSDVWKGMTNIHVHVVQISPKSQVENKGIRRALRAIEPISSSISQPFLIFLSDTTVSAPLICDHVSDLARRHFGLKIIHVVEVSRGMEHTATFLCHDPSGSPVLGELEDNDGEEEVFTVTVISPMQPLGKQTPSISIHRVLSMNEAPFLTKPLDSGMMVTLTSKTRSSMLVKHKAIDSSCSAHTGYYLHRLRPRSSLMNKRLWPPISSKAAGQGKRAEKRPRTLDREADILQKHIQSSTLAPSK